MLHKLFKPFFPIKYSPLYGQYMGWTFISNIIGSIEDCVSTHCMLSTLTTHSNDLSISYNYIGKNMIGQIGGLFCIHKIGSDIDNNPKKYLKHSLYANQFALFMECMTPLVQSHFLILAGGSSLLKSIAWTGYGAVSTKIIVSLSENNIAEMYSKLTIVNTVASSIGMILGLYIIYLVPCHMSRIVFIPFLTCGRLYTMHRAVRNLL